MSKSRFRRNKAFKHKLERAAAVRLFLSGVRITYTCSCYTCQREAKNLLAMRRPYEA